MEALEHQQIALNEIVARARAYFRGDWRNLNLYPRWASLIVGPSGSGKTAVAAMAAEALGVSLLRVAAPSWMPLGTNNRGARETSVVIAEHVARNARTLLCIDEADKLLDRNGDNSWKSFVRNEIFDLLDVRWPAGLNMPEREDGYDIKIEALNDKLRNSVFVIAIATFQSWFDEADSRRAIGFGAEVSPAKDELTADIIAEKLPRELANRFHCSIIRLPELQPSDYHRIAKEAQSKLPERMRTPFQVEIATRIPGAIAAKKGVRFLEEGLMEVLKNLPPEPSPPAPDFFQVTTDVDLCRL